MTIRDCGIQIVHDRDAYICGRVGSEICSDCGTSLCADHAEACEFCLKVYCDCCMFFHLKNRTRGSRSVRQFRSIGEALSQSGPASRQEFMQSKIFFALVAGFILTTVLNALDCTKGKRIPLQ